MRARRAFGAAAAVLLAGLWALPARADERIVFATDGVPGVEQGGFYQALAKGFYRKYGLDVVIRPGGPGGDAARLLMSGAADLAIASDGAVALDLVRAGAKVRAVMAAFQKDPRAPTTQPRDDGHASYSGMVLAPQALIDARPAMVRAFVEASIQGWSDYVNGDPAPGNELIKRTNPAESDGEIEDGIRALKTSGIVQGGDAAAHGIGTMTDARWKAYFRAEVSRNLYPADLDYRSAYTDEFLPE